MIIECQLLGLMHVLHLFSTNYDISASNVIKYLCLRFLLYIIFHIDMIHMA